MEKDTIVIKGARENNLKNINLEIPRNQLVIMTGVSGSGKTSLAFDTIYAEGQRRYVESLSAYARQFLGGVEKPDVDLIEGLSPSIAIDQKTTSNNPRSTVGTVTEIYDYLRLLYARIGVPYCPDHHVPIVGQTIKQMVDHVMAMEDNTRLTILSPAIKRQKGTHKDLLEKLRREGYVRIRVDGVVQEIDANITLDKNQRHDIDVVVDRIIKKEENRSRIHDSIENALSLSEGIVMIASGEQETLFSSNFACPICGFSIPPLEPRLFSFNSPLGACEHCKGLGIVQQVDLDLLMPDKNLTISQGGIRYYKWIVNTENLEWQHYEVLLKHYKIDKNKPLKDMTAKEMEILLYGSKEPIRYTIASRGGNVYTRNEYVEGVVSLIERRFAETQSSMAREWYNSYMADLECPVCHGKRLNKMALAVQVDGENLAQFTAHSVVGALDFVQNLNLTDTQREISKLVLQEIQNRLTFLKNVGLDYLTLDRMAGSLSGGEAQRIRLATQIGSRLTGVLYVLDEPSIGLHQRDNAKLIAALKDMRDLGNTLIVVEHDEETMMESDFIVDIGPGAGESGGEVVAAGPPQVIMDCAESITGQYLSKKMKIEVPQKRRKGNGSFLKVRNAHENNLKNLNLNLPLGTFICVTGVSGSGKSSLVNEVIAKSLLNRLSSPRIKPGKVDRVGGMENVDKIVVIDQDPIGRTPRSNPATYTGVFDPIRELFANSVEAKIRGYDKGRFSFNVKGGRCELCQGDGVKRISMHFLPDVYVPCEECGGKRYNEETLQVTYKDKNIYDVLEMTVAQALTFFSAIPRIKNKIQTLYDVGLGYIKLGQSATTLSGGEAQRVKLASELQRPATGKTVYVLDEPTTGLHSDDVKRLLAVLQRICDNGDTVMIIEHNLDIIKSADWIVDLGPEGGDFGGTIVATGTPEQVAENPASYTGAYLKKVLEKNK